jgi:hypothetical protein
MRSLPKSRVAPDCRSVWLGMSLLHGNAFHDPGERRDRARISSRRAITPARSAANFIQLPVTLQTWPPPV